MRIYFTWKAWASSNGNNSKYCGELGKKTVQLNFLSISPFFTIFLVHRKLLQGHCEFFWASFVTLCVEAPFILRHPNCLSLALFLWCKLLDRIRQRRPNEWKIDDLLCPPPPDFLITHKKSWQKKNLESNVSSPKSRQEQKSYNYPPQSPLGYVCKTF